MMMKKCNAGLLLELESYRLAREKLLAKGAPREAIAELDAQQVDVFVTYSGDVSLLHDCKLSVGRYDGTVATGKIPLADVERLGRLDGVTRINLASRVNLHIDRSIPEIKANAVRSNAPPYVSTTGAPPYTGRGVLVGVIDDSIYERHWSFLVPNPNPRIQKTRILAIWDQVTAPNAAKGQKSPPGFNYGTFWDEAAINGVLAAGAASVGAIRLASVADHGSHVTGIAAGNGSGKDSQFKPFTFVGVAPEANIAFSNAARYDSSGGNVSDAVNFMFDLAAERDQPCVINMSFGTHEGARDGSSDLEQAIDRALIDADGDPIPGRAVVVSAGNDADMRRHSRKNIAANGSLSFRLEVGEITFPNGFVIRKAKPAGDKIIGFDKLYVWYDGASAIKIRVTPPGAKPDPAGFLNPGDIKVTQILGVVVSDLPDPANGKNFITVTLFAPVSYGQWTIEMQELSGNATAVDVWVDRIGDDYIYPRFMPGDNVTDNTVTCPSTAKSAIAVGAYASEPSFKAGEKYGAICRFSSRGLDSVFGASEQETRPHIVAPGRRIISANNSVYVDDEKGITGISLRFDGWTLAMHAMMSGTSQAAPHVSGVIALMFQRNPALTFKDIIAIFKATATKNQIPDITFPNRTWGYGKLDARAAVLAVPLP